MENATQQQAREYASLESVAVYLDCSVKTIRRMIAAGELTGYRIGKRMIRVDMRQVEALAKAIPTSEAAQY